MSPLASPFRSTMRRSGCGKLIPTSLMRISDSRLSIHVETNRKTGGILRISMYQVLNTRIHGAHIQVHTHPPCEGGKWKPNKLLTIQQIYINRLRSWAEKHISIWFLFAHMRSKRSVHTSTHVWFLSAT